MPTICPAAIVDMDREVPGKTAESTWHRPIQIACPSDICSTWLVCGSPRVLQESTAHITMPPISSDQAITVRLSRCLPIVLVSKNRSEEHTSELQSHVNLVCRLLLEK